MEIKTKIQWFSTVWLLVLMLLINSAIYFLFYKITTDTELERLKAQTETIVVAMHTAEGMVSSELLRAFVPLNGMIRIINDEQHILSAVTKDSRLLDIPVQFRSHESYTITSLDEGERLAIVYFPIIWTDGSVVTLEVTESLAPIQANLHTLRIVLLIASLSILIPSIIGGRLLSNLILRPISSMVDTMREIQERGIFKKIAITHRTKDELYTMADTFNRMIERLKTSFEKQQQFVSDASHELKTPLTVIDSYTSLLKRWGVKKPEVFNEAVEAISTEVARMKEFTQQMLTLAQDDSEGELELKTIDLVSLCYKTRRPFLQMHDREIGIQHDDEHVYAVADEQKIMQVMYILLDNALKYSERDILIRIGKKTDYACVAVEDKGSGIPEKDLPHIFDRFYRVDKARTRATGGAGLGLSIAQQIIQAHGGDILVESEEHVGTTFIVQLPQAR